jgi:splicing factor 3B subunit 5
MSADRFNFNKSWEHIQNKYVATGHSDMTKFEWAVNQHRETLSSYVAHYDVLSYFAVMQNESTGRIRYQMLEVSLFSRFRGYSMINLLLLVFLSENATALWPATTKGR